MALVSEGLYRPDSKVVQAFFLVIVRVQPGNPTDPNVQIVGAALTRARADEICLGIPGSWVEKIRAGK